MKRNSFSNVSVKKVWVLVPLVLAACGGGGEPMDDDDSVGDGPAAVTLVFPEENKTCTEGTVISDTQSRVIFQWNASEDADSYEVNLRNLNTNTTEVNPSNTNEVEIVLSRGTPYEWYVTSKADDTEATTDSDKWKFYNQGVGVTQYAPFPAEAVNPKQGRTINVNGSLTLQWTGSDVDNDIVDYEVKFGVANPPNDTLAITAQNSTTATVVSGQTYYWRVITRDSHGNTSQSTIFQFRVE